MKRSLSGGGRRGFLVRYASLDRLGKMAMKRKPVHPHAGAASVNTSNISQSVHMLRVADKRHEAQTFYWHQRSSGCVRACRTEILPPCALHYWALSACLLSGGGGPVGPKVKTSYTC